jgi:DNA topoisomerase-1
LAKAKTVVVSSVVSSSNGAKASPVAERKFQTSRTRCPQCKNYLAKIPSNKVTKKYFLKCLSGCEDTVLFWSDRTKSWEAPRSQAAKSANSAKPPVKITTYFCPVCKKPLEEYSYTKDGQNKTMLRCSDSKSRNDQKHKDVAYFTTAKGWWSPKFGELKC